MVSEEEISSATSRDLARQVVIFKLLNIRKELAIKCMQELEQRKENGDEFDFNSFINEEMNNSPKPMDLKDKKLISSILKMDFSK